MLVAGMARSGTTWVAEVVCSQLPCRLMFEPFAADKVTAYRGFEYHQYIRPEADHPRLAEYVQRLLEGRIRNRWIDRYVDQLRPRFRLVKAVRASLFLRWIHDRFPAVPLLKLGWASERDLQSIMAQKELVDDHLGSFLDAIARARLPHQKHAVLWCVLNRIPLRQFAGGGLHAFYYEDLLQQPEREIPRLFAALGRAFDDTVYDRLRRPSRTARAGSSFESATPGAPAWLGELGRARADDVLEVVAAFGLDHLYDGEGNPTGRLGVEASDNGATQDSGAETDHADEPHAPQ